MNTKKWKINKNGIKKSIESVIKSKDIEKLSKDTYDFTMNLGGFIAHYDINGFKWEYTNTADFVRDLQNSSDIKRPDYYINDRFFSEGEQSEYYADKSEILRFIADIVKDIEVKDRISESWNEDDILNIKRL